MEGLTRNWYIPVLVILTLIIIEQWNANDRLQGDLSQYGAIINACSETIDDANDNIAALNGEIDSAAEVAWANYEAMGDALTALHDVPQIDNTCDTLFFHD